MDQSTPPSTDLWGRSIQTMWNTQILTQAMPLLKFEKFQILSFEKRYSLWDYQEEIAGTSFDIDDDGELRCPS